MKTRSTSLSEDERRVRQRLKDDFPHFAEKCLKIRTKSGRIEPFVLNRAQRHVHRQLEAQRAATGKVRALLLKARQQGFSTYIAGRFYWQATHRRGTQVFILTHEQDATANLFGMVERYHAHNHPLVKPSTGAANAKTLYFDRLDSGYSVGTAGAKAVGRSKTVQLLHGSEVAFWKNAAEHFAGLVQAVPDLPGTEIVLESTANGMGGDYHARWVQAEAGIGDYIAIFVPWFWSDEYRRTPPEGFVLDEEEAAYASAHGLDLEQMAWRRAKIAELKDPLLFRQEYPATAAEAFQTTGHESFIPPELVLKARKADCPPGRALVLGVDPARFGEDRFSIAWRAGRKLIKVESRTRLDVVQGANWVRQAIDAGRPRRVFVDVGGVGAGVVDLLRDMGAPYDGLVVPVNFGGAPEDPPGVDDAGRELPGPRNRRAEMWTRSKAWLEDPAGADIPDRDTLQADACAPGFRYDAAQRLVLESKDEMRRRGARSPDEWDAVALTFAETVNAPSGEASALPLPNYGFV
jgi:hypothetical protein